MAIPSVAAGAVRVAPAPVQDAPVSAKNAPPAAPATQAASVTISHTARLVAAASTPPAAANDALKAARAAVAHGAATTQSAAPQTTTSQYAAKVRAVLARGGTTDLTRIMSSLGIPQAEQVRVAEALGTTPKSAS
jgi:hypothetical protein